jgi:hypothetical protein
MPPDEIHLPGLRLFLRMKKILMLVAVVMGAVATSHAGVDVHVGIGIPLPGIVIGHPAPPRVVVQRPPVVYYPPAPVYYPPAPVYCPPPAPVYCPPAPVVMAPRPVCPPAPVVYAPPTKVVYKYKAHGHWHRY